MKKICTAAIMLVLAGLQIKAADIFSTTNQADTVSQDQISTNLFRAEEWSVDIYGSGRENTQRTTSDRVRDGFVRSAGVGINYFVTTQLGLGVDLYSENTTHDFVDNVSGNAILRLPLEHFHLAPYIFGGGGYKFDPVNTSFGQLGAGVEYRFCRNGGVFADARFVLANRISNYALGRIGLRFIF